MSQNGVVYHKSERLISLSSNSNSNSSNGANAGFGNSEEEPPRVHWCIRRGEGDREEEERTQLAHISCRRAYAAMHKDVGYVSVCVSVCVCLGAVGMFAPSQTPRIQTNLYMMAGRHHNLPLLLHIAALSETESHAAGSECILGGSYIYNCGQVRWFPLRSCCCARLVIECRLQ